jgi:hypothetical protein
MNGRTLRLAVSLSLLAAALAAGCEDNERNEAQLLIDRLERVEEDSPLPIRQHELDGVRRLGLSSPAVVRVRDACVRAHDALLTAEREQTTARAALERATRAGAQLPAADAARIASAIERSDRAIASSRQLFPACQEGTRGLSLRFGGRAHSP